MSVVGSALRNLFGRLRSSASLSAPPRTLSATAPIEVLSPTNSNNPYWYMASGASANQTTNPEYRKAIRNRARMEVLNNSYARGMILTKAEDIVGRGPRLRVVSQNREAARALETLWETWSTAIRLVERMTTGEQAKIVDGEAFYVFENNPGLPGQVKLDVRLYEADHFFTPWGYDQWGADTAYPMYDGIEFDALGNVSNYWKTKMHPGHLYAPLQALKMEDFQKLPADQVLHQYRMDRPEQSRGVCEIVSILDRLVDLRAYTAATVKASERAANLSVGLQSDMPPGECDDITDPICTPITIPNDALFNLPAGWKAYQLRSEMPPTAYSDFVKQVLREIARCLNMPAAVATGDSSDHNYASGRLDYQMYVKEIEVNRKRLELYFLNMLFAAWLEEAMLIPGFMPPVDSFTYRWYWDGREPVDPLKAAQADATRFNLGLLPEEDYWAENYGLTPEQAMEQLQRTVDFRRENGLPLPGMLVTQISQAPDEEERDLSETKDDGEED